jgi:hypothetical protein
MTLLGAVLLAASLAPAAPAAAWDRLLAAYVRGDAVDYAAWKRDGRADLRAHLASVSATRKADYDRWSRAERLAFWLNAYNAAVVEVVLDRHPLASIRDVGDAPFEAFRRDVLPLPHLLGGSVSLDHVEKEILAKELRDPRVHVALVCAARSCPALRPEAYDATRLDAQLDDDARRFLSDPSRNRWDPATRTLHLSKVFEWYAADFGGPAGVRSFVARYLPAGVGEEVRSGRARVAFLEYDWALNDARR